MALAAEATAALARPVRPAPVNRRVDRWWVQPLVTVVVLSSFVAYATWSAFTPHGYYAGHVGADYRDYLSPLYSPCITDHCGNGITWHLVDWWPFSAAILMLPFPLLFRVTCYYYRKAYYRSFWLAPPACAVPDTHRRYTGESRFPLILQNVHRYAFYLAVPFPIILLWEAIRGLRFGGGWGFGLGGLILFLNAILLFAYTWGCHAGRHVCGGHLDAFAKGPIRYWVWQKMSWLNVHHMGFAWISLLWVAWTDGYVRLVAAGVFHDPRFF